VKSKESDAAPPAAVRWSEKIMIDNASSIQVADSAPQLSRFSLRGIVRPDADCGRERIHAPRHGFPWQSLNTTDLVDLTAALRSSVNTAFCAFCAAHSTPPGRIVRSSRRLLRCQVGSIRVPIGDTPDLPYFSYRRFWGVQASSSPRAVCGWTPARSCWTRQRFPALSLV
jgi:hypothetical protein